jgi:hypothetical protein
MLPSPPSTNYSRAYIQPLVQKQEEPAAFSFIQSVHHVYMPRLQRLSVSVGHPIFFPICFSFLHHHLPYFCSSLHPFHFLLHLPICNHHFCCSLCCSLSQPHLAMTSQPSALQLTARNLGCLTACSSHNAPPKLPFNRQTQLQNIQ